MDPPHDGVTRKLESWFSTLLPIRMDVVGDFAGRELFVIEGDSLLRIAFSDERIDMGEGLQVLHSVYVVERFLHNLESRGCRFHVTFFELHQNLCIPEYAHRDNCYKYQLARACIIQHLRRYSETTSTHRAHVSGDGVSGEDQQTVRSGSTASTDLEFQVHVFQSPYSREFDLYLKAIRPYFILTHDGSALNQIDSENLSRVTMQKKMFLGFIRHAMAINYTIGLIHEVDFQNSKVFTMIIRASVANALPANAFSQFSESLSQELQTPLEPTFKDDNIHDLVRSVNIKPKLDASTLLHLHSLAVLINEKTVKISPVHVTLFLLHLTLKRFLSLSQRRISGIRMSRGSVIAAADGFMRSLALCQLKLLSNTSYSNSLLTATSGVDSGLADHIDGRLWKYLLANRSSIQNKAFPSEVSAYYATLVEVFQSDSGLDVSHFCLQDSLSSSLNSCSQMPHKPCVGEQLHEGKKRPHKEEQEFDFSDLFSDLFLCDDTTDDTRQSLRVLPFSNPVFNKHLSCIQLAIDAELTAQMAAPSPLEKALYETHWHSTKRLDEMRLKGGKLIRIAPKPKWWQLKGDQVFRAKMLRYAKNLAGGEINPEVIVVQNQSGKAARNQASVTNNVQQTKSNTSAKTSKVKPSNPGGTQGVKAEQIRAANEQRMSMKNHQRAAAAWKSFYRDICMRCETRRGMVVALSGFITKSKDEGVTIEARLFRCCVLFEIWKEEYCVSDVNKRSGYNVIALIFHEARLILSSSNLTVNIKDSLDTIFTLLGLTPLPSPKSFPSPGKVAFILSPPIPSKALTNTQVGKNFSLHEFQLQYCGPYMERNLDPEDDTRVKFKPDAWQIKVLDALDEDKSVFVVAPTSAGKTFIAYYAMEKILRADNDGILVYVAPTKALVNQIAAEVQSRFDKKYKDSHTVWAIHTRDYRVNNPQKCQILVTVPHILQIMLLSPALASTWSPGEDGIVWEQILLLAPCPIIALSATVGNPVQFHRWLQITQSSIVRQKPGKRSNSKEIVQGVAVELIHHRHRYNDLRKFYYNEAIGSDSNFIDDGTIFGGLEKVPVGAHIGVPNLDDIPRFQFIHPVAALSEFDDHLPDDLVLESRDCYTLWRAMVKVQNAKYPVPKDLEPTSARFPEIINKVDVIKWEEALKCVLRAWMRDRDSPMGKLLDLLRSKTKAKPDDRSEPKQKQKNDPKGKKNDSLHCEDTVQLLSDLHKLNALPALLFMYDRQGCDYLCKRLVRILEKGEDHYRQTNPEWKRKVEEKQSFDKIKKRMKAPKKIAAGDIEDPRDIPDASSMDHFDPSQPIQEFTFADRSKCSKEELREEIQGLMRAEIPEVFVRALQRGIGIHHAGISRSLRECVERLFRRGFLRAVIATGTLSLGINMPCATVVFVTDDLYLTPLNYRQASGRAGRRGFDLLGNVVFHEIALHRAYRLMNSHLPSLTGHFPTSTTLILRLFILLYASGNSDHAVTSINALLSQNRISVGLEHGSFNQQVMHHVRFSIEYLRRTNLLSASGVPINFANCVANLYYTEPGNFMLNALLRAGVFHKICDRFSTARLSVTESESVKDAVNKELIVILAHFFGRMPFKRGTNVEELLQSRSSSTVVLRELPQEALEVIREHNQLTLDIFINYVKTFAEQHCASVPDDTLPYTGVRFSPIAASTPVDLDNSLPLCTARSSFVSLSGHSDNFVSLDDLLTSCRGDILLESSGIPYVPVDDNTKLNAYLYDFFLHGSAAELDKANGIPRSNVWFLLNDFSMVLATIVTCLRNLFMYGPDGDMKLADVDQLGRGFEGAGDELEAKRDVMTGADENNGTKNTSSRAKGGPSTEGEVSEEEFSDDNSDDSDDSEYYLGESTSEESNERERLLKVLKGFVGLQEAFNEKFKAMWATKSDRVNKAGEKRNKRPKVRI
ncbi:hypothetical protein BDZ91DRAFT_753278 [Kalaharituber pfeilii]|nr:hypothetical protein BDZ91DRAFT_753278 [Kalaharituber pfeilii]